MPITVAYGSIRLSPLRWPCAANSFFLPASLQLGPKTCFRPPAAGFGRSAHRIRSPSRGGERLGLAGGH